MEAWVEWEATAFAPAERSLAKAKDAGGAVPSEALTSLKHVEEKLTGQWLVDGVRRFFFYFK